ncbi:MAG: Amylopullulanase precursor [Bacteroidetes bacterium ADurb.Bin397]|nr:MAG: Amylopullulanase precursor [Bacteroidetes bacterium ADurb.Bin397]
MVRDVNGHWERPDSTVRYRVYRFTNSENPETQTPVYIGQFNTRKGYRLNETTDSDPNLRSEYGNKTWWYRIRTLDAAGNTSQWSTAVSATVKDITPPKIPTNVATKGFEDYISVKWKLNSEPDISSYMIYRSLCHLGSWVECLPQDTCRVWQSYNPYNMNIAGEAPKTSLAYLDNKNRLPCPCSGPFVFLGELTHDSLKKAVTAGNFFYDDRTITGSPLCYAYWIKAKDLSGNMSGKCPIPSPEERPEIACERLHDLTPPDPALISGLFAMNECIRVEWLGPPSQDIRAYHVYRAEGMIPAREPDISYFKWVGGMTVELPPAMPVLLSKPYEAPSVAKCDRISVQATPWMSQGYFTDKSIEPKKTYWYRVVSIDYDGNETKLEKSAAISTFSFSSRIPDAPVLNNPIADASSCGVTLSWLPAYDAAKHRGFVVYRSNSASGNFVPIVSAPLTYNNFTDTNVVKGQTYHYRVAVLLLNGKLSAASTVKSVTL